MQEELMGYAPNYTSTSFPEPRDFQNTAHDKLREGAKAGHRCQIIMAPTGGGKTFLGLRIIHEALSKKKRAIFVCDRETLINQTSAVADSYGLGAHSIIQSGHWRYDLKMPFQIASAQTLARRKWPDADVIVIDEVHTQYATWVNHIQNTNAAVIGLSATPFSKGLGRLFTNLINAATMHDLTQSGVLVPMRVMSCTKINMEGAATSGGEWKVEAAAERGMEIIGDVVTEWQKHAENRKTIVFGATIAHCEEMARQFNESGIMAAVFTSDTLESERKSLLEEFNKPDSMIRVLISVEALAKGFDVKDVGCVCDCRPLRKSLSTAIQMWGRGLRSSPETGKTDCILLDFSGNIIRFADDFSEVYYNGLDELDAGEKLDKAIRRDPEDKEPSKCPSCGFSPCGKRCISCGHERQPKSLIEHLPGEMVEVMVGKQKLADDKKHLYEQVCTYTRSHGNPATARQRAWYLFQDLAGCKPSQFWKFDDQPNIPITQNTLNHIKRKQIAFAKMRKQA
jgi:superfamily II DNA or RNA helicase